MAKRLFETIKVTNTSIMCALFYYSKEIDIYTIKIYKMTLHDTEVVGTPVLPKIPCSAFLQCLFIILKITGLNGKLLRNNSFYIFVYEI